MNDNALFALIISIITAQETAAGIAGIPIAQAFQPQQQGVNTAPTIYLHKIGDRRLGYPERKDVWDTDSQTMVHTELQQYESTFQISALATQDPANTSAPTASDIVNAVAYIMQSDQTVTTLESQQPYAVGILKIVEVRNPYFKDDRDRFEASPSFDFTLTHKQVILGTVPIISKEIFQILDV